MIELKSEWSAERLLALAKSEGLESSRVRRFACPAKCSDSGDSVAVSDASNGAVWHCHRCGVGGSVVDLLMHTRRTDVGGALRELEQLSNVVPIRPTGPAKEVPDAAALWQGMAAKDEAGEAYLLGRGLAGAAVRFNVGASANPWLNKLARNGYRLVLPLYSTAGVIVSFQLRSVVKGVKGNDAKRSLAGCPYPPDGVAFGAVGQARTAARVYLTEGIADTLALQLAGVPVLGAPGVDQLRRLVGFLGKAEGREVVLCPQNDSHEKSQQAFASLAGKLRKAGAVVLELTTPAPHKDPAEWREALVLDPAAGAAAFAAAVAAAPAPIQREPGADDGEEQADLPTGDASAQPGDGQVVEIPVKRPEVRITVEQHEVNDHASEALARDLNIFQRGDRLVQVIREPDKSKSTGLKRPPAAPRIKALPAAVLRERLTAVATWVKFSKTEHMWMPAHPPDWSVNAIHARGTWLSVRPLAGVVEAPVLRPDGTVLDQPGYDESTQLLFEPNAVYLPIPSHPTRTEAQAAILELLEIVSDFPFEHPEHQSAWVAALLTPFARHSFAGPVPLTLIDANSRGAGKSLMADLISLVFCGRPMAKMSNTDDDAEMAKRVMSIALAGDPLVLLDNVDGLLGGETLNKTLTSETVKDRLLNTNDTPEVPIFAQWLATGNNVQLHGDMPRRTLHIRLNTDMERPEEREGFRHPDIRSWVRENRPRLVRAALLVLRAYCVAGEPQEPIKSWGSFEGWSRSIRQTLVWVGMRDPGLTREELTSASDTDAELLGQLIAGWEELDVMGSGYTVADALKRVEEEPQKLANLRQAFDTLCGRNPPTPSRVTGKMRRFKERVCGGKSLRLTIDPSTKVGVWAVRRTDSGCLRVSPGVSGSEVSENFSSQNPFR